MNGLRIASDLVLPPAIVGMRMPVFAEPGAGKSVFLAVLMEELWRLRLQFVCIDPLGTGWGIKTSADGKSAGIPVPYLGGTGRYADAPLRADGGGIVARALAETGASMMLNLAPFSRSDQNRFVADMWNELLRIAGDRHESGRPLSLLNLVDEAAFFMPEQARSTEQARAQDAGERVARQGRSLGLGFVTPTQRGQSLDKDVVGTWEIFVLMRLTDKRAIDAAIREFEHVVGATTALEIRKSLPHLANGEAWIVAPRALDITRRVQLRMRDTYDSTRTPTPGERQLVPAFLAHADLSALRDALAAQPAPQTPAAAVGAKAKAKRETLRAPANAVQDQRIARLEREVTMASDRVTTLETENRDLRARLDAIGKIVVAHPENGALIQTAVNLVAKVNTAATPRTASPRRPAERVVEQKNDIHPAARKLLAALAQHAPARFTWGQTATLAGLKPSGGHFNAGRKALRDMNHVDENGELVWASAAGLQAAGEVPPAPSTAAERLDMWCGRLPSPAPDMLRTIAARGEAGIAIDELAAALGKKATGGHWNTGMKILRNNGLIEVDGRNLRAAALLRA